jgi:molecular chaperone DnaK
VYAAEKMLKDTADKVGASDKQPVQSAIDEMKKALEKNDAAAIKAAMDGLTAAQHKFAEALYKQAAPGSGAAGPGGTAPGAEPPKSDVIDAEVVDEGKP